MVVAYILKLNYNCEYDVLIIDLYFWFGLNSALRPLRSAMAMRIVIAITIVTTITAATTPPAMMATVLSELELAGPPAVCDGGVVIDVLPPGPTGTAQWKSNDCMLAVAEDLVSSYLTSQL